MSEKNLKEEIAEEEDELLENDVEEDSKELEKKLEEDPSALAPVSDDMLKSYLNKISQFSPLSREEEYELGKRIQDGDEEALNKLILSNLKFVVSIANRYKNSGISMTDLINQGNVGLVEAAKRFDPERGVKFISYAVWWIRQAIIQALAEQSGTVKLPIKQASILYKINEAVEKLTKENGKEPTPYELSQYLDMDTEDIENILRVSRNYLSLEVPIKEGEDKSFIDLLESETGSVEQEIIHGTLTEALSEIVDELSEREAKIIKWRFGMEGEAPKTLEEVGEMLQISRERVRQVESRALAKLRKKAMKRKLSDYLN
ncbi:RNA polymerase, sigma 70 subunit, RpoD subfamily [Flexistipes sinusarabici DSM 4947]|uniref:RNA polymerase, sigma 70 subunit, RpoD subfamily n=2 Tax=Flexistipes sinusarabici TaxID=2352 RepID=F8E6G7_FLESM|nr:RNA polymerase sigma factor RpoD/SigA [Flexistipes sinusarabici]AEI14804.1 RNA polymerase, sigma 70 subunit, RpoD subfamily [Flexistipes sinusarabici DSM 4947]